ncbi:hypothetical protein GQ457_16G019460 [Hibiscus cannabinus]
MPSCYASYHHRTTSHRLITHPTKPRSISRLSQHFAKTEDTALLGSPRPHHFSILLSTMQPRIIYMLSLAFNYIHENEK